MKAILLGTLILITGAWAFATVRSEGPAARTTYVCTSRSLSGKRFSATGTDRPLTQEAAMKLCEQHNFRCYRTGCTP